MDGYNIARANMIDCQLRPNRVSDPVLLKAFMDIPREEFVNKEQVTLAYADTTLEIGEGRVMMPPMFFGKLLQEMQITRDDVVLDIACGLGFGCAVLSKLASTVVGLESSSGLVEEGNSILSRIAADNAAIINGDVTRGVPEQGPYDVIIIEGGVKETPASLSEQLSEGGRMGVFEILGNGSGQAVSYLKIGETLSRRVLFDAILPVLNEFESEECFVF